MDGRLVSRIVHLSGMKDFRVWHLSVPVWKDGPLELRESRLLWDSRAELNRLFRWIQLRLADVLLVLSNASLANNFNLKHC